MGRPRTIDLDRLLACADAVVRRDGAGALTFDAVATEAGVSKGALLHHFPSKQALLEAMLGRLVDRYAAFARGEGKGGSDTLADHARDSLATPGDEDPLALALLAVAARDRSMLAPLKAANRELLDRFGDVGDDSSEAALVLFALDGLWLSELLGISALEEGERERFAARLTALAESVRR